MKIKNTNIDVSNDFRGVRLICEVSGKCVPIGVVRNTNKRFSITIAGTIDKVNNQPRGFLNEYNVI